MTATILDVARQAGVSAGTVSRVLNDHPSVSDENRQKVLRAIERLRYRRRQQKVSAADLYPLRGRNVLLLLLGMDQSLARLPVVAAAMHGVESALRESGANLLFADVPYPDRVPDVLQRNRIDALVLKGALQGALIENMAPALRDALARLPIVWFLGRPDGAPGDVVQANDMHVGRLAAQCLLDHGHRRLAFLSPKPTQTTLMRREASFVFYAQRGGATVETFLGSEQQWPFPSPAVDQVEMVQELVDRLLQRPQRPTAVFAPDDSIAVLIYRALAQRGLAVGQDLSLVCCNREPSLLMGLLPTPTAIDTHAEQIGRRAIDQLNWRFQHRGAPAVEIAIEPELVEGESVRSLVR